MKVISIQDKEFIPASHEDKNDPGVVKKVLLSPDDFDPACHMRMLNYALIKKGRRFQAHLHQTLEEFFYIISGKAEIKTKALTETEIADLLDSDLIKKVNSKEIKSDIDDDAAMSQAQLEQVLEGAESQIIEKDSVVLIPRNTIHLMTNVGEEDLIYLAVGAFSGDGDTIVFE